MSKRKSLYSPHPSIAMVQNALAGLKEKTGRTLDEWIAIIDRDGPAAAKDRREWLKTKHKLGTNVAVWVAERSVGEGLENSDPEHYLKAAERYVADMFAGPKAELKPIYDALLSLCFRLGKDVKACPCTTIAPIYRTHVIAQIKPATLKRIDFGLALRDTKPTGRLIDTGGFAKKDRITHRIAIASLADIDAEVKRWLRTAYEMDG